MSRDQLGILSFEMKRPRLGVESMSSSSPALQPVYGPAQSFINLEFEGRPLKLHISAISGQRLAAFLMGGLELANLDLQLGYRDGYPPEAQDRA
jgi:hypothetical protein